MPTEKEICSLVCQASKASSLQEIANLAFAILGNPVFIEDRAQVKLAYTKNVNIDHPSWQKDIVASESKFSLVQSQIVEVSIAYEGSIKSHMPVIIKDSHIPYPKLIKAITIGGVHVATMVATAYCRPIVDEDIELMEILSSFVTTNIQKSNYTLSTNKYAIENLLIRLLNGEKISPDAVLAHTNVQNWPDRPITYVLAICSESTKQAETNHLQEILNEFRPSSNCHTLIYDNLIIRIHNSDHSISNWETETPNLAEILKKRNLIAGVSQEFSDLCQLHHYFQQARCMIEVASTIRNGRPFFVYDENSIYHMMDILPQDINLKEFCHRKIIALEEYDEKNNTDLVPTLHIYLENHNSIAKTSDIMRIHRNTVSYRINRCFDLLDTRIEDGNELFSFILSLRILEYCNKKNGYLPPFQRT
jgi:PucR family transcriptional regulator, proline-responsive transcriptional activator